MIKKAPNPISEIKLTYRSKVKAKDRPKVSCSDDAYQLFRENWDDCTINLYEEFKILLLDTSNRCLGIVPISKGGITGTVVDIRLIFACALKAKASAIVLGHNHPSDGTDPSQADKGITQKMEVAGTLLDIPIIDHIILTDESYYSFSDDGLIDTSRGKNSLNLG
jgi:DNA repair protein RadC